MLQRCSTPPVTTLHMTMSPDVVSQMALIRSLIKSNAPSPSPPSPHTAGPAPPPAAEWSSHEGAGSAGEAGEAGEAEGKRRLWTLVLSPATKIVHSRCPSLQLCSTGNSFLMGKAQRPTGHDSPVARSDRVMEPLRLPVRTQDEEAEEPGKSASAQMLSSWQGRVLVRAWDCMRTSHRHTTPSLAAETSAMLLPPPMMRTHRTMSWWPFSLPILLLLRVSHRRTALSLHPVAATLHSTRYGAVCQRGKRPPAVERQVGAVYAGALLAAHQHVAMCPADSIRRVFARAAARHLRVPQTAQAVETGADLHTMSQFRTDWTPRQRSRICRWN